MKRGGTAQAIGSAAQAPLLGRLNVKKEASMGDSRAHVSSVMRNTIHDHNLLDAESAALLMVSGGSDSTALSYLAAELREASEVGALAMLHVNHKLRGSDAEDDAQFTAALADALDIPFFLCEIDVAAEAAREGGNIEAVGRRERYVAAYEALASMCEHEGFSTDKGRILTAHTADDRIENFYMRSIVGTGPGGFRSMLYRNGPVVRPLLDCTRDGLRDYIEARPEEGRFAVRDGAGALWREDATNAHTDRFRAYVRANIVPRAKEWSAQMPQTLTRTMNLIADEDDMLCEMTDELIEQCVEYDAEKGEFRLLPQFGRERKPLCRRALVVLMKRLLGADVRIDTATIEAIMAAFADGAPIGGYVSNVQGDLAVSANKRGVLVEPMASFRARRKRR